MRAFTVAALMLIVVAPSVAGAQTAPAPAAAAPAVAPGAAGYSVADTELGALLDDPAAKALLDKYLPGLSSNEQIDMARSMTLKSLQQYKPDVLTDAALAALQADLSKLPAKK
jgi:para-nitrobenzyl esterase